MPKFLYLNMKAHFKCGEDKKALDSFTVCYNMIKFIEAYVIFTQC